jgi:predicted DNA-binding transcriptional regulator YafY
MNHPTTRVLAVLELLQAHGPMTGAALAQRLNVTPRTVRRYITTLETIGVPITAERGRYGAYALVPGYKLPPMMFTGEETVALALGLVAAGKLGLTEAEPAVASALAKLERVMPAKLRNRVRAVSEATTLDLAATTARSASATIIGLSVAARERRTVELRHLASNGTCTERNVDPYGLVFRSGRWYLIGYCHLRDAVRTFRLDRIDAVHLLERHFEAPSAFDTASHLRHTLATIPRPFGAEVLLRAELDVVLEYLPADLGLYEPCGAGVLLRARTTSLQWLAHQLATLPLDFEIVDPPALRETLRRHAERLFVMSASRSAHTQRDQRPAGTG